ncbi:Arc family DNA-binding protein [Phyllobacterium calauticae]|jgi:Arc-like DNA binding domain|uniref:Arc family DNA-binding protein n=1 Tax=Phyllobacterium calauticae TaxID=2817027 RepID=UPI001CC0A0B2|nr:Arc family DNA-binding protein [Phyllobacterium calauticae]MBZ3693221.1 Arc family DNA-binding protein [Phyllobacterium calauticae]
MAREDPQLKLRLTEDMKARVTKAAVDSNRSVNAEIVARLEDSFAYGGDFLQLHSAKGLMWRMLTAWGLDPSDPRRAATEELVFLYLAGVPDDDLTIVARTTGLLDGDIERLEIDQPNFEAMIDIITRTRDAAFVRLAGLMRKKGWKVEAPKGIDVNS